MDFVRFVERRNLVSARVPSHFKRSLPAQFLKVIPQLLRPLPRFPVTSSLYLPFNDVFWKAVRTQDVTNPVKPPFFLMTCRMFICGPGSSIGIANDYGLDGPGIESRWGVRFPARPDRPWGPPSLLYDGYRVSPGGKVRPGRAADH